MKSAKALLFVGIVTTGLLLSIGYVSISQSISSMTKEEKTEVKEVDELNVEITNVEVLEKEGSASNDVPTYTKTAATFNTTLVQNGDSVVYNVTIKNKGKKKVKLSNINITEQEKGSEAVYYSAETPSEELEPGEETTMNVVAFYDSLYRGYTTSSSKSATATVQYELVK
jgi:hypothetical protein